MRIRLQKVLAQAGYGSRRKCEILIKEGRVSVNGECATLGTKVDLCTDTILLDGNRINPATTYTYIVLNKPVNVVSSKKAQDGRLTVYELVSSAKNLSIAGRLDVDSEGLLLLTNDGELANRLTHPRYMHQKEYHVLVEPSPTSEQMEKWCKGIQLTDGFQTHAASIRVIRKALNQAWISITLTEGHKRQIRESGKCLGLRVKRIIRIRIGNITLGDLKTGQWRFLSKQEISALREYSGLPK